MCVNIKNNLSSFKTSSIDIDIPLNHNPQWTSGKKAEKQRKQTATLINLFCLLFALTVHISSLFNDWGESEGEKIRVKSDERERLQVDLRLFWENSRLFSSCRR